MEGRGRSQWICGRSVLCKPVDTASHYFDEEQDPDPDIDPNSTEKLDPDPQTLKRLRIRICIKVMGTRKPGAMCNLFIRKKTR